MKDFWEYAKGIAYVLVLIIGVYLGLAEGHEWWPFKPTETSPNAVYAYSDSEWEEGYDEGYSEGRWEGYHEGYDDGFDCIWFAVEAAEDYAKECWTCLDEALGVIDYYENGKPLYGEDSPPTEEEYNEAIQFLYHFCQYFYCEMYEELRE